MSIVWWVRFSSCCLLSCGWCKLIISVWVHAEAVFASSVMSFHVQLLKAIILGSGRGYHCRSVIDITSKMSADKELLVLSAAASAVTSSLVAFSSRKRKHAKRLWMHPLFLQQHKYCNLIPPNAVIGCNTFAWWIFSSTFESLHLLHAWIAVRCMQ